ncbi:hypothetical protein K505DRAFT_341524 [Melanomma pulvis-pyrius CBS 109.77]|uniref:Uncharacterized protein n=1 Tax=Melanomma pulvis-pyrius CBS 109.77 TaxID=1314802 RepID=A0A6A6WYX7_9PLEO|nr:hypothetical protein K505DRAFT_341524 [Melanomma pulvis-pyrius CBS 109.77]
MPQTSSDGSFVGIAVCLAKVQVEIGRQLVNDRANLVRMRWHPCIIDVPGKLCREVEGADRVAVNGSPVSVNYRSSDLGLISRVRWRPHHQASPVRRSPTLEVVPHHRQARLPQSPALQFRLNSTTTTAVRRAIEKEPRYAADPHSPPRAAQTDDLDEHVCDCNPRMVTTPRSAGEADGLAAILPVPRHVISPYNFIVRHTPAVAEEDLNATDARGSLMEYGCTYHRVPQKTGRKKKETVRLLRSFSTKRLGSSCHPSTKTTIIPSYHAKTTQSGH